MCNLEKKNQVPHRLNYTYYLTPLSIAYSNYQDNKRPYKCSDPQYQTII
jgi:hypothetical protein